ncbi:UNVERIFIED_CONTAM: hypothetical protein RKD50_003802 [Streptomyces canus]
MIIILMTENKYSLTAKSVAGATIAPRTLEWTLKAVTDCFEGDPADDNSPEFIKELIDTSLPMFSLYRSFGRRDPITHHGIHFHKSAHMGFLGLQVPVVPTLRPSNS